jgi:NAD(P)-dependent dehydrogenase (short-subunit alcohol dehydrogenase family)
VVLGHSAPQNGSGNNGDGKTEAAAMTGNGQVAIVTGAASGLGRAMTIGLLTAGIDVAGVDRNADGLADVGAAARGALHAVGADLADPAAFERIVADVLGRFGRIDVLVNNAGIGQSGVRADQRRNPIRFWEATPEQWSRFLAVNATAPIMLARAVLPHMLARKAGRIITVTTSLGTMVRAGPCCTAPARRRPRRRWRCCRTTLPTPV